MFYLTVDNEDDLNALSFDCNLPNSQEFISALENWDSKLFDSGELFAGYLLMNQNE